MNFYFSEVSEIPGPCDINQVSETSGPYDIKHICKSGNKNAIFFAFKQWHHLQQVPLMTLSQP